MATYRKQRAFAPAGFFECEGRGLQWLGEARAQGGPRVVDVYGWGDGYLDIERVEACSPTPHAAYRFGAALARMHDAGAAHFGSAPAGYDGTCYFGPLQDPVPMDVGAWDDPVTYYAEGRLIPIVEMGIRRRTLDRDDLELTRRVIDAMPEILGKASDDRPARVHGDLWSGNVMWTRDADGETEAVLIDPAAHGGHREEDLAMLHLFGMSYLSNIYEGYESVHPLRKGFADRLTLWQLYPIAGHCVFFGGGYVSEYREMCRSLLD